MRSYTISQVAIAYSALPFGLTLTVGKDGCFVVYKVRDEMEIYPEPFQETAQYAIGTDDKNVYLLMKFGTMPWLMARCIWKDDTSVGYIQPQLKVCVVEEQCRVLAVKNETLPSSFTKTLLLYMKKAQNTLDGSEPELDTLLATRKLTIRVG